MNEKIINRINLLPELVINQIAAGEVVERPASIVKELIENSIDAHSTLIRVYLESGGLSSIKVVDNGDGIHPDDLPLVFLQHTTSKITATTDLINICSLGFRGEALASIASVTKANIISSQTPPQGTTVEVKDLFYNIPARRKFLKSEKTEFNYALEIFKRIALSNFNIGFMLYHNNKLIKNLPINVDNQQNIHRLSKIFGKKFTDHAIFFNVEQNGLKLSGWISKVESISSTNIQYLYINKRIVKDKLLNSAIRQATTKLSLPQAYCIYLELEPLLVDINVHPTKQEVRFREPNLIYAFVYQNILEILSGKNSSNNLLYANNNINDITINTDNNIITDSISNIKLFYIFNNKYIIFQKEPSEIIFLDVFAALKWLLIKKLQNTNLLSCYQLIIPERIKLDINNSVNIEKYIQLLENFKFIVDQIHDNILLIRAVPNCFCLLNVVINYRLFLLELLQNKINHLDGSIIIQLLVKYINTENIYTKSELINLIEELTKEHFCFNIFNEQRFSKLIINN